MFPSAGIEFWLLVAGAMLMAATLGFVAGSFHARSAGKRALARARKNVGRLFQAVSSSLAAAEEACAVLEKSSQLLLNNDQLARLEAVQNSLVSSINHIVERQKSGELAERASTEARPAKNGKKLKKLQWVTEPTATLTDLPGRDAFSANLEALLEAGRDAGQTSGLLLIQVDKFQSLANRFQRTGAQKLLKRMSLVVLRAVSDEDLVCQIGDDVLAVLFRGASAEVGKRAAESIRDGIRHHAFRIEESGPEVLVTASFGYTTCLPDDNVELARSRAGDALARSRKRGRNQLHVFDGNSPVLCAPRS